MGNGNILDSRMERLCAEFMKIFERNNLVYTEMIKSFLEQQAQSEQELNDKLNRIIDIGERYVTYLEKGDEQSSQKNYVEADYTIEPKAEKIEPEQTESEEKLPYKRQIELLAAEIVKKNPHAFRSIKDVLHHMYTEITKDYGICWEQEMKDFKMEYGYRPISTLDLIDKWGGDKHYKGILYDKLYDLNCNIEDISVMDNRLYHIEDWNEVDLMVKAIANITHNKSTGGCNIYSTIVSRMTNRYRISWKNQYTRYMNRHPEYSKKQRVPRTKIIAENMRLQNYFIEELNLYIDELLANPVRGTESCQVDR